jgi:hypothetical protein
MAAAQRPVRRLSWGGRVLVGAAVAAVLALVFASWLDPDLMVTFANQVWACF